MLKIALAATGGFFGGLLVFAVGREVMFVFRLRVAGEVIGDALSAVGSLSWVDTTLVTGLAAVTAAALSIRAVKDQIRASDAAVQRQIEHGVLVEKNRRDAKRAAARATLPIYLSIICDYAETNGRSLYSLVRQCVDWTLPRSVPLPEFPEIPFEAATALRELVELSDASERVFLGSLLGEMQVQSSRLRGLERDRSAGIVAQHNLESYLADSVEIYARASELFDFGRDPNAKIPDSLSENAIGTGLHVMGVWDDEISTRVRRQVVRSSAHKRGQH
ncbi:hypothetical protein QTA58_05095 [Neorhizobium sp. CSC1952]|uniref:hypothetical protein n=1 Tax=Neorhizobium sp. CSC1952 TaxID=2978974 RepID=UPI0025A4D32C|nr:hypothetical protein [Rhizobium sp. CSC1952]WJR68137.1 hypothetical protein QTA58_05095 [Rhizobium sp. CSC1952]